MLNYSFHRDREAFPNGNLRRVFHYQISGGKLKALKNRPTNLFFLQTHG